jgi:alkanesulfonate monooxygenase SsuD/methylene tetrahydromethanopterin reductase-like flavin-dependent oxidoreductase (luciferase family)
VKNSKEYNLGIMFRREHAPEHLPGFVRRAEEAGFDELWLVEDNLYGGGIASAATALAVTEAISVGVGIMPAVVRNPVFAAMEIATLSRLYPNRFLPGLGHGVASWMRQIGAFPRSQLKALEEVTITIQEMLAGERLTYDGEYIHLNEAELVHPPAQNPPISLGVRGPKSLALSGRVADGTILAEYSAPAYVSWAREQIEGGKVEAGHNREHHLTVFALTCAGSTISAARQQLRPLVASAMASGKLDSQLAPMVILPRLHELLKSGDHEQFEAAMPGSWIDQLAIAGTPEDWQSAINRLVEAGADTVVLVPLPGKGLEELDVFSRHLANLR